VERSPKLTSLAFTLAVLLIVAAASAGRTASTSRTAVPFTAAQAVAGARLFEAHCAACHGSSLEGGAGPALSGATLNTLAKNTHLTVGDMFAFIAQQMPLNEPASLKHSEYADIMAYILSQNGYKSGTDKLTYQAAMKSSVPIASHKSGKSSGAPQ
jgi:polar amino acid transport system substrate-binding protein